MKWKGFLVPAILWVIAGVLAFMYIQNKDLDGKIQHVFKRTKKIDTQTNLEKITIYKAASNPLKLVTEEAEIDKSRTEDEQIREVVGKVLGENSPVKILGMYMNGSDLYLDLSKEFLDASKSPEEELYLIYSIVNSVTEIKSIKRVKILIAGQETNRSKYSVLSKFYERNTSL